MTRVKNLYVIRLDEAVLQEPKFREENPGYRRWKPCAYVGVKSLDPEGALSTTQEAATRPHDTPGSTASTSCEGSTRG